MGIVEELKRLIDEFKFFEIVNEYQQGVYYQRGIVVPKKQRINASMHGKKLDELCLEEAAVDSFRYFIPFASPHVPKGFKRSSLHGGLMADKDYRPEKQKPDKPKAEKPPYRIASPLRSMKYYIPFSRPKVPSGFRRSFVHGGLISEKRYSRVLLPGAYLRWPLIDDIIIEDVKERNEGLDEVVRVPLKNNGNMMLTLGGNLRYEINNLDQALNEVKDYKKSLSDQVLSILAKHAWGQDYAYWGIQDNIEKLQKTVTDEVKKTVEKWGIKVHIFYITKCAIGSAHNVFYEGNPVGIHMPLPPLQH